MARRLTGLAALLAFAGGIATTVILTEGHPPALRKAAGTTAAQLGPQPRSWVRSPRGVPVWGIPEEHDRPVPILMYHVLGPPSSNATYPELFVPPAELAAQTNGCPTTAATPSPWGRCSHTGAAPPGCRQNRSCSPSTTAT
jgi:hypothetical protein